jgi:hypothetical protein
MGVSDYYRRFIIGFSKIAILATSLKKRGVKFEWTSKREEGFQQLKEILTSVPVLKMDEYFVVCTDAWKEWIGGVLTQ